MARGIFVRRYTNEFRRRESVDPARVELWQGALATARLAEGIEEERDGMLAIVTRCLKGGTH